MKPCPGINSTEKQKIFNYRLLRYRRVIENAFGISAARWRIFNQTNRAIVVKAEKFVLPTLLQHYYFRQTGNACYTSIGFVNLESRDDILQLEK